MASALDHLETLEKTYKYITGAQDLVNASKKIHAFSKSTPKDLTAAKKALGMAKNEFIPLSKFLIGTQETVNAAVKAGFPDIADPAVEARKRMEKIAKSAGPNSAGFEKELTTYIKQLEKYEFSLRERIAYMKIVQKKCDLNIKNFTYMNKLINGTVTLLKALVVAVPSARNEAGNAIVKIMATGIETQAPRVVVAYTKLKKSAVAHETEISREQIFAKGRLKNARDKKISFLMEDAKAFFKKLF